jgi:translation initiation factor 2D
VAASTPVDIKHSRFKSITAFLKASAKEGLINIKETKGAAVVTGMHYRHVTEGWINEGSNVGVDGSHSSVRAHISHVTVKDVEVHEEKQEEVQTRETGMAAEAHHWRQVTLLRKPGPFSAPFFRRIGKEWVLLDSQLALVADMNVAPVQRNF